MRAQIVADQPTVTVQPLESPLQPLSSNNVVEAAVIPAAAAAAPQALLDTTSTDAENSSSTSSCPFLAAMGEPQVVDMPWHRRFLQLTNPYRMQRILLDETMQPGKAAMVQMDSTVGFAASYAPGTGDAVKQVLAGESGNDPITRQAMLPSMGECQGFRV